MGCLVVGFFVSRVVRLWCGLWLFVVVLFNRSCFLVHCQRFFFFNPLSTLRPHFVAELDLVRLARFAISFPHVEGAASPLQTLVVPGS